MTSVVPSTHNAVERWNQCNTRFGFAAFSIISICILTAHVYNAFASHEEAIANQRHFADGVFVPLGIATLGVIASSLFSIYARKQVTALQSPASRTSSSSMLKEFFAINLTMFALTTVVGSWGEVKLMSVLDQPVNMQSVVMSDAGSLMALFGFLAQSWSQLCFTTDNFLEGWANQLNNGGDARVDYRDMAIGLMAGGIAGWVGGWILDLIFEYIVNPKMKHERQASRVIRQPEPGSDARLLHSHAEMQDYTSGHQSASTGGQPSQSVPMSSTCYWLLLHGAIFARAAAMEFSRTLVQDIAEGRIYEKGFFSGDFGLRVVANMASSVICSLFVPTAMHVLTKYKLAEPAQDSSSVAGIVMSYSLQLALLKFAANLYQGFSGNVFVQLGTIALEEVAQSYLGASGKLPMPPVDTVTAAVVEAVTPNLRGISMS